jgi:transitional endoplasmic reticulum ATPase
MAGRRGRRSWLQESPVFQHRTHEPDLVRLWLLRMLFQFGCLGQFVQKDDFDNSSVAYFLGLKEFVEEGNFDRKKILEKLKHNHTELEHRSANGKLQYSEVLAGNMALLQEVAGLNADECSLLVFAVLMETDRALSHACAHWLDDVSTHICFGMLSQILNIEHDLVIAALSSRGKLIRCGLLSMDGRANCSVRHRIDVLEGFSNRLLSRVSTTEDFLSNMVKPGKLPTLDVVDYRHIQKDMDLLVRYLPAAMADTKRGVNVLIYGSPGTGKSELVRLLAQRLQFDLLEVSSEDEDGGSIVGRSRLRAFKAAQQFFASKKTLILFDEIQDIFDDGESIFGKSTAQLRKAEINTLLEENPLPAFWLSNDASCMDAAFIRRFDIVLELDVPPMSRRREILSQVVADLPVPDANIKRIAKHEYLSPAVMQRAASVVRAVRSNMDEGEVPQLLESMFNQTLQAQGYAPIKKQAANALPDFYDPALVNAGVDLKALAEGIRNNPSARICLYGPPGTGKSAFAQWLAEQLQRPFHSKKLSDILSMWVGGTEANLRKAFTEAEQDNAVLLLDEVDSFLQDRRNAQRSWELTQVNEMLTQMEAFNGLFIASTNLMSNLDQAALRRFDMKIHLDYLRPAQAWQLFDKQCAAMGFAQPSLNLQESLYALHLLTPGDFAAVHRRHRFHPVADANALLEGLREECAVKEGSQTRRIGFV